MFWQFSRGATTLLFDEPANAAAPPTFGPFRVLHQIGSGVLGPVFRTHDSRQDRLVAIKAFKLDLIPEQAETLAEALRALVRTAPEHRSAVSVIDAGLEGHTPYLAMAFETRETLDQLVRRGDVGPADRIAALVRQLAEVIDVFAKEGCHHGALHPRDVFVTASGTGVRVTGFGVSQALAAAGIRWPGRRPYAAPERGGPDWNIRSDVYALGAIAHELLTGRRPAGTGEQDGEFGPDVPLGQRPRLRRLLATALADWPEDRFASAGDLATALAEPLGQTLETAPAPAPVEDHARVVPVVLPIETTVEFPAEEPVEEPLEEPIARSAAPIEEADETFEAPLAPPIIGTDRAAPSDDLVLRPGSVLFADLGTPSDRLRPDEPIEAPIEGEDALLEARPWDEDAIPMVATRRWDGIAAVVLAGLALGALVIIAGARLLAPEPGTEAGAQPAIASTERQTAPAPPVPEPAPETGPAAAPAETAAPRPAPAPLAPGRVIVESDPEGAIVTIDGRLLGGTPVTARNLPFGSYTVQVARPGYVPARTSVTLTAAAPTQSLRLSLEPGLPQPGAPPPPAGPPGAIDVDSRPRGARVSIDGRFVGNAPLRLADLEPGTHALTVEMSGYTGASRRVEVEPGGVSRLVVDLE
jgi:serine/threonine-protein kinase